MTTGKSQKVVLHKDKDTTNTVRFAATEDDAVVSTLYINKGAEVLEGDPTAVEIEIKAK